MIQPLGEVASTAAGKGEAGRGRGHDECLWSAVHSGGSRGGGGARCGGRRGGGGVPGGGLWGVGNGDAAQPWTSTPPVTCVCSRRGRAEGRRVGHRRVLSCDTRLGCVGLPPTPDDCASTLAPATANGLPADPPCGRYRALSLRRGARGYFPRDFPLHPTLALPLGPRRSCHP